MKDISWIRSDRVDDMMRQKIQDDAEIEEMAGMEREMIERMTKLEVMFENHVKNADKQFDDANKTLVGVSAKVDQLYDIFTQAKGARYVMAFGLAGIGGVVGAKASAIMQYFGFRVP